MQHLPRQTRDKDTWRHVTDQLAEAYRKRGLLPSAILQPVLLEKVRPMFLRGDYDLATFEAFKQVEISVRTAAS